MKFNNWYFNFLLIFVLGISIYSSIYLFNYKKNELNESLISRVQTLAESLSLNEDFSKLSFSESDIGNLPYEKIKNSLIKIREANSDARFIYVLTNIEGKAVFVVDSEESSSSDYSPPGQVYNEASPELISVLEGAKPMIEGPYSDRWGRWVSPLAYFSTDDTNNFLVGLDIDAKAYRLDMFVFSIIPSLVFLFIFFLIWIAHFIRLNEQKVIEAKSKFISTASHDLRSPLTGISWSIENILRNDSISDSIREKVEELRVASKKLLELIDGLMDLSLIEEGVKKTNPSEFSVLSEIISDVYKCQKAFADSKEVSLSGFELVPNIKVKGAASKIYSVFNNIVSNAVKYSNNGGEISLNINTASNGKNIDVYIIDNGIGIPKEDLLKISEGFFRSENAKKYTDIGTGYGLYNSDSLIKAVGGSIKIESEEGKGTKVIISLLISN